MPTREMPKSFRLVLESPLAKRRQQFDTWLYRKTGGRIRGKLRGAPLLLLTTCGRKSGQPRTAPLIYLEHGQELVVVASKGGSDASPLWYSNLQSSPSVEVEQGAHRRAMRARTASSAERATLWPRLVALYPPYADYQSWTDREIPVVVLSDRNCSEQSFTPPTSAAIEPPVDS